MALIACKNCGKKISDTVETCIHCGTKTKEEEPALLSDEYCEVQENDEQDTSKVIRDFTFYSADERISLEREFLNSDNWAKNYRRTFEELPSYLRIVLLSFAWSIFIMLFATTQELVVELTFSPGKEIFLFSIIAHSVLLVITIIATIVVRIKLKLTSAKYIYMKKFQIWLYREKAIDYTPPLLKLKEKRIFDSIDLDSI